jgi:hypothetical protein
MDLWTFPPKMGSCREGNAQMVIDGGGRKKEGGNALGLGGLKTPRAKLTVRKRNGGMEYELGYIDEVAIEFLLSSNWGIIIVKIIRKRISKKLMNFPKYFEFAASNECADRSLNTCDENADW